MKVYRCIDGSEVRERPAPFEVQNGPRYVIHSPSWVAVGPPGCLAEVVAEDLARQWREGMERAKASILANMAVPK